MGKLTLLGMLDLSAAFDCVDHSILLRRLEVSFGFGGAVLDWMRSYLVGRKQYIRYNGSTSSTTVVQFGVPQGSVLGPLFFILYTAAVFHIAEELGFLINGYADDLQLYDHCLARDTAQLSVRLAHCSLHRGHGPMDVQQPPQVECFENGGHLAGLDSPPGWMHLRPDHHRWRSNSTILHGSWSRCLHWFWHELHGSCLQADADELLSHSSAPVHPSVAHCGFFARPGPSTDSDATGLLQRTPRWGTKVSPQPVVSRPAGCSSFDSAASLHQQCRKRDSHRAALAWCPCEGDFQAVLARSSVSSWVGSALSWSGTSSQSALSSDAISVRPPRARCLCLDVDKTSLPVDLRCSVFWLSDLTQKSAVIYLLCPFEAIFCIVLSLWTALLWQFFGPVSKINFAENLL